MGTRLREGRSRRRVSGAIAIWCPATVMWSTSRLVLRRLPLSFLSRSFAKEVEVAAPQAPVKALYLKQLHEPKYLALLKPRIPFYDRVNLRLRGLDYPVLEDYARFVQKLCKDLRLEVCGFWGVPAVSLRLDSYQAASELVINSDVVKIHERTVQVKHLTSCTTSTLIDAMMCTRPPGVEVRVARHTVDDEDVRFIPDLQLQALEKELEELRSEPVSVLSPVKKKKK